MAKWLYELSFSLLWHSTLKFLFLSKLIGTNKDNIMFMDFLCILIFTEKKKSLQEYQIIFWHCSQKKKRNNPDKALQYVRKKRIKYVKYLTMLWRTLRNFVKCSFRYPWCPEKEWYLNLLFWLLNQSLSFKRRTKKNAGSLSLFVNQSHYVKQSSKNNRNFQKLRMFSIL